MVPVESLITLRSRGHTINELSRIVEASDVLGFPVITGSASSSHDFTNGAKAVDLGRAAASKGIIGYITRQDVAHVLKTALPANGDDECLFIEPEANERGIDFSEYVELSQIMSVKTPLLVVARTMQTLGLSYCLFAENGELRGSMTIKDLWYCLKTFKTETFLASTDGEIDDLDGEHDSDARLLSNRSDI
jgi:hypothetical protein